MRRDRGERPFGYLRRQPDELQAEVDEELRAHLEMRIDDLVAKGMSAEAARCEALRQFGDLEYTRRYCRSQDKRKETGMRWNLLVDELAHDLRSGLRQTVRTPGFTAIVVLTLALGIGANTALFSIFNSLMLRPLPVRDPAGLALIQNGSWSYPIWDEIRARETDLFDGALAWSAQRFDLSAAGHADVVDGAYVSAGFFDVLGVGAARGRMLTPTDDAAAPDGPVAVISHRLWQQRFAGANDVVGRQITVQRVPFTIAGVMPAGFFGPDVGLMTDVILPVRTAEPLIRGKESRLSRTGSHWLQIMVRLKPGQSVEQATAALGSIHRLGELEAARGRNARSFTLVPAATGNSPLRRRFETPLRAMVIAVGLLLLVACGNIASLILARTMTRRREFSVRLALGSSRLRIARLLFIESLLVVVMGAALGLVFASWGSAFLVRQLNTWQSTVSLDLVLDWRVLAFTAALACLSAIVAGVVPALGFARVAAGDTLKDGGRSIAGDGRLFVRGTLVVVQIAVSCVLVVGAGLFLRTFASLHQLPLGFVPEQVLIAELNLQASGGLPESRVARVERLREAAAAVPGVRSASVAAERNLTGAGSGWSAGQVGVGDAPVSPTGRPGLWLNATTPGWFETMGIPLRSGRDFGVNDRAGSPYVAIVNEAFLRRFLHGGRPVGQTVRIGRSELFGFEPNARFEIVGVAGDAVYTTPREGMPATMFVPMAQRKPSMFWEEVALTIKAAPGKRALVERDVATALTKADPAIAFTFGTFDQLIEATVTQERLIALLSAFFGGLALLLAALGLYGLVAHSVRARQMEFGLRMALGAASSSIVRLVFRRVGVLIAAGLALGLAVSFWAARFVGALLFDLEARDPVTFGGAALVLVAVGLVAAWIPARRAGRLDPTIALREG
ncbi:MAG: ABC transporter permease [Vicinamibacterales bacterium]